MTVVSKDFHKTGGIKVVEGKLMGWQSLLDQLESSDAKN
jgi:hypothetical protein